MKGVPPFKSPVAGSVPFDDTGRSFNAENVQEAISANDIGVQAARYSVILQNNGTISDGTFIGYDSLISGDDTPIVIPRNSTFIEFTFSNSSSNADYTLIFRKNSIVATPFYSVSKVNTQFFSQQLGGSEMDFVSGDQIYIQYQDDGQNASDAVLVLFFRSTP